MRFAEHLIAVLLLASALGTVSAARGAAPPDNLVTETDKAAAQSKEATSQKYNEIKEKLQAMWKDVGAPPNQANPADPLGLFGLADVEKNSKESQEAAAKIEVTEQDLRALDAYANGQAPAAEALLRDAKRPFPLFLHGCVLFDEGKFADAAGRFDAACALIPGSRTCLIFAGMSRELAKTPGTTDEALPAAYDVAYREALNRLPISEKAPTLLGAFTSSLTFDPFRVRFELASVRIIQKRRLGILQDLLTERDLNRKITLALMIEPGAGRMTVLSLAKEHPENKELQVYAFLLRNFGNINDYDSKRGAGYAAELKVAQGIEPDNGFLTLLGIDSSTEVEDKPLTADELAVFKRAARGKGYNSYLRYRSEELAKEYAARPGFAIDTTRANGAHPMANGVALVAARRASKAMIQMLEEGKKDGAALLRSDIDSLILKVRGESPDMIFTLFADSMASQVARDLYKYAERAGKADLLEQALAQREQLLRQETLYMLGIDGMSALLELPTDRVRRLLQQADSKTMILEGAARQLRLNGDIIAKTALADLAEAPDVGMNNNLANRAVIRLQLLKDRDALPLLKRAAAYEDPLLRRLAREAVADLEGKQ